MKRIISLTITLCLVLGCFLPIHASTIEDYQFYTSPSAITYDQFHINEDHLGNHQETRATSVSDTTTHDLLDDLIRVFTGSGGTMYNSISELESWLTPVGSFNTSHSITGVTLYEIIDYIAWTLSGTGPTVYDTLSFLLTSSSNIESILGSIGNNQSFSKALIGDYTLYNSSMSTQDTSRYSHRGLYGDQANYPLSGLWYNIPTINSDGTITANGFRTNWFYGTPIGNLAVMLYRGLINDAEMFKDRWIADLKHYNDTLTTWEHSNNTQTSFTPESAIQGLYRYLAYIQSDTGQGFYKLFYNMPSSYSRFKNQFADGSYTTATTNINSFAQGLFSIFYDDYNSLHALNSSYYLGSVSLTGSNLNSYNQSYRSTDQLIGYGFSNLSLPLKRLAFVLANDEEIAARNAAKNNQTAVVNNFVASTGNGSASTSDIGAISDLSSGYKSNFGSDASISGIFNIFSSNNMGWFSQETKNQLDTTSQSRYTYQTPLLDQQIQDIYEAIGVEPDESR